MLKKIERVFVVHTTKTVQFYSYYSGRPYQLIEIMGTDVWEAADRALKELNDEHQTQFIIAFLRAMRRYREDHLCVVIDWNEGLSIREQDGSERFHALPSWDLNDIVKELKRMRNSSDAKKKNFASDVLTRLFCGTRRFNNKREK